MARHGSYFRTVYTTSQANSAGTWNMFGLPSGSTVERIRLRYYLTATALDPSKTGLSPDYDTETAIGITALDQGVTDIPDPNGDKNGSDWLWWSLVDWDRTLYNYQDPTSGTIYQTGYLTGPRGGSGEIDIRAMRLSRQNDLQLWLSWANLRGGSSPTPLLIIPFVAVSCFILDPAGST